MRRYANSTPLAFLLWHAYKSYITVHVTICMQSGTMLMPPCASFHACLLIVIVCYAVGTMYMYNLQHGPPRMARPPPPPPPNNVKNYKARYRITHGVQELHNGKQM